MKKCLTLLLVFLMTFSLLVLPVSAEETSSVIWQDKIDKIPENTNILYESSSTTKPTSSHYDENGGFYVSLNAANYTLTTNSKRVGTFDETTKAVTGLSTFFGYQGATETVQDRYDNGQQLVIGSEISGTYSGTDSSKTGWWIQGQPMKGAAITKDKDPENDENYVLKYDFGQTGSNKASAGLSGGIYTRLMAGTEEYITEIDDTNHTAKGKMVYEWKVRVPAASVPLFQKSTSSPHISLGGVVSASNNVRLLRDMVYAKVTEDGGYELNVQYKVTDAETGATVSYPAVVLSADTWYSFKEVISIDETTLSTGRPLVDVYVDGVRTGSYRTTDDYKLKGSATEGWKTGKWMAGLGPDATGVAATDASNLIVYYDDINQYWLSDTLTVSGISDSYVGFASTDKIEVTYSQAADFEALSDAISVTKDGGEVNVTAIVTPKDEYTAYITFTGLDMTAENTYDVTISEFADIFGNKNTDSKTFTITTIEAGKLNISKSVESVDYEIGTHSYIALTADAKADISNVSFYIKNSDGEKIEEITPTANEESTVFTFDLYDIEALKEEGGFTFISEGTFAEAEGERLNSDAVSIPVNAIYYGYNGEYIVNADFEDSTKDANWLTTSNSIATNWGISWRHNNYGRGEYALNNSGVYSFKDGSCNRCTTTDYADTYLTDYFIGVVEDPKDSDNSVIKYQAGKNGDGVHYARAYYKTAKDVDTAKNVVVSSKILLTESLKDYILNDGCTDLPVMYTYNFDSDAFTKAQFKATSSGMTLTATGGFTTTLETDEWFELKYVIMPTTARTETTDAESNVTAVAYDTWTYMVYINDLLIDVEEQTVFKGANNTLTKDGITYSGGFVTTNNTGLTMGGISFGIAPVNNGEVTPTFYVDDVKFYQPEKLSAELTQNGKTVSIALNNQISKNAIENVVLKDEAGNVVENGLLSAEASKDYKTLVLAVNDEEASNSTQYYVDGIYDVCGQMPATEISFETPKSYSLYVDSVTGIDTSVSGKVKATVKIVNAKGMVLPALVAVTVYSNKKEMIGLYAMEFAGMDTSGYEDEITIDIGDHQESEIESIKVHLWDGLATQVPYQMAEKAVY